MIDPQYYSILAPSLEAAFARPQTIRRSSGQPPVITWEDGQPAPTDAEINAACATWIATGRLAAMRQRAVDFLAEQEERYTMVLRSLMLIMLDEFNSHADKTNAILTAIDNSNNLAQLKSSIAAIADYPARTASQLRTAMQNKLTAGDTDS